MSSQITDGVCGSSTLPHVNEKSSYQTELSEEQIPSSPEFTVKDRMNVVTAEWEEPICQHLSLGLFCSGSRTKPHMQRCWTEQDRKKATGWTSILYSWSLLIRHFSSYWSSAGLDAETNRGVLLVSLLHLCSLCEQYKGCSRKCFMIAFREVSSRKLDVTLRFTKSCACIHRCWKLLVVTTLKEWWYSLSLCQDGKSQRKSPWQRKNWHH